MNTPITVIPSRQRRHVEAGWYDSHQSFGRGPDDHFGGLVVPNESVIAPGAGFPPHRHAQMEIVTWIFSGAMEHADSEGHRTRIEPGIAQRMSAGTGIVHAEVNPDQTVRSHGVQMYGLAHLFIGTGAVELEGVGVLSRGDVARAHRAGERRITATEDTELLVWQFAETR